MARTPSDRPGLRHRRPLLVLLVLGFVAGLLWLTRNAWAWWRPQQIASGPVPPPTTTGLPGPAVEPAATLPPPDPALPAPAAPADAEGAAPAPLSPADPVLAGAASDAVATDEAATAAALGRLDAVDAVDAVAAVDPVRAVETVEAADEADVAARPLGDDLTRIEGVGPRMAAALHGAGIATFDAIAGMSVDDLRQAIAGQGVRFAPSLVTWPAQARLLADGDEAGFSALTARLGRGAVPRQG